MDQRQLVKKLEEHFRNEEKSLHNQRKRILEERSAQSDEEWWDELIERTMSIRPQMLEIFERNKAEMIAKRFETASSEEGFREKMIQKRVMELLPHVSAVRREEESNGDLTSEQISLALVRQSADLAIPKVKMDVPENPDHDLDSIDNLIEIQLRRQQELN